MKTVAEVSKIRVWRYLLWRNWDYDLQMMNVTRLNPSTSEEMKDNAIIRICIGIVRD
jgi:hypothetical protein